MMFIANNFILALAHLIDIVLNIYMFIIIGRAVISWFSMDPYNPVVRFLYEATEPVLGRIRRVIPCTIGGMDFSPMIVFIAIYFLRDFLVPTLRHLAM